jgi:hypothetical protein
MFGNIGSTTYDTKRNEFHLQLSGPANQCGIRQVGEWQRSTDSKYCGRQRKLEEHPTT